jgi:hypothetical protein
VVDWRRVEGGVVINRFDESLAVIDDLAINVVNVSVLIPVNSRMGG